MKNNLIFFYLATIILALNFTQKCYAPNNQHNIQNNLQNILAVQPPVQNFPVNPNNNIIPGQPFAQNLIIPNHNIGAAKIIGITTLSIATASTLTYLSSLLKKYLSPSIYRAIITILLTNPVLAHVFIPAIFVSNIMASFEKNFLSQTLQELDKLKENKELAHVFMLAILGPIVGTLFEKNFLSQEQSQELDRLEENKQKEIVT